MLDWGRTNFEFHHGTLFLRHLLVVSRIRSLFHAGMDTPKSGWTPYDYYTTTLVENHKKATEKNTILLSFEWVKLQENLTFALSFVRLCYFFVIKPVRGKGRISINSFVLISLH